MWLEGANSFHIMKKACEKPSSKPPIRLKCSKMGKRPVENVRNQEFSGELLWKTPLDPLVCGLTAQPVKIMMHTTLQQIR